MQRGDGLLPTGALLHSFPGVPCSRSGWGSNTAAPHRPLTTQRPHQQPLTETRITNGAASYERVLVYALQSPSQSTFLQRKHNGMTRTTKYGMTECVFCFYRLGHTC